MAESYTIVYRNAGGGRRTLTCSFSCACTIASILDGVVMDDVAGREYLPRDFPELVRDVVGSAIASDILMWNVIDAHKRKK